MYYQDTKGLHMFNHDLLAIMCKSGDGIIKVQYLSVHKKVKSIYKSIIRTWWKFKETLISMYKEGKQNLVIKRRHTSGWLRLARLFLLGIRSEDASMSADYHNLFHGPPKRNRRRQRVIFDDATIVQLNTEFHKDQYPCVTKREQIAEKVNIPESRIHVSYTRPVIHIHTLVNYS